MPLDYTLLRERAAREHELPEAARKTLEQRVRRIAERQRLALQRSRRRDPHAPDFGLFRLVDPETNAVVASGSPRDYSMSLAEALDWLLKD